MRWEDIVDVEELRKTISILKPSCQLFEVRILGGDKKKILSGYFTDCDSLISAFDKVDLRGQNIYITINNVNEALYSRSQHDKFIANTNTTSDPEIDSYQWLFIDFDPVRPTNISSSDAELKLAEELKDIVKGYLQEIGFSEPVQALSGNGYHLLYRIDFPNTEENILLVNDCLTALAERFNTQKVKVDTTNSNPSRICKLHGTLAQKGANTKSRPHRMSRILSAPDVIEITEREKLVVLASQIKKVEKKTSAKNTPKQEFDIKDFLFRNGMTYKEDVGRDCQMYLLDECPFDHNHKNGDSKIFAYSDGAIAFKCHHNSCKQYKWQDVRLKFEPDAYDSKIDDARIEEAYQKHKSEKKSQQEEQPKTEKKKYKLRKLKTVAELLEKELPDPKVFVGVGEELPFLVEGTCILSAKPKLGKSWLVLSMCEAVTAGRDFLGYKTNKCSCLYLDLETGEALGQRRAKKVLNGREVSKKFYIDQDTNRLDEGFVEQIEYYLEQDPDIGIVVIDVFQTVRSKAQSIKETEYSHAYRDITPLNELAQKHHLSIILVCHDRKMVDADDPFANILGSTGLQGAATQMMVMFKNNKCDPIHISIKGKTIDGLPELDVALENGQWSRVDALARRGKEKEIAYEEYLNSNIRKAVLELARTRVLWKGRCSTIVNDAMEFDIPITESPKEIGGFLHRHQGKFLEHDGVKIQIVTNGTGPKIYKITKSTIDTIDENLLDDWEPAENIAFF